MSKSQSVTDSVSKALSALALLDTHESLRISDIGRELNIPISTAHRLLNILRSHGFADQDPLTRRYRLGTKAVSLGGGRAKERSLPVTARPHLEQLGAEVNETVNLVILDGPDALFIDGVESRQSVRVATRTGSRIPAYAAAGGKIMLAYLPSSSVKARYPEGLAKITDHTISSLQELELELSDVKKVGYALNLGEHLVDVRAIAVPVAGPQNTPVAALTVAGPVTRWDRSQLIELAPRLIRVAQRISDELSEGVEA